MEPTPWSFPFCLEDQTFECEIVSFEVLLEYLEFFFDSLEFEEFEFEAAKEVSQQTAARAERVRKAQEANIAPIAPVPQQNDAGVIDV